MNKRNKRFTFWLGIHHQRRQYPLEVQAMQYHCFDNIDQVLFHPSREQTSQKACASGHRPDGTNQGAATQRRLHLPIFYGKGCSYSEQKALIVQPSELADQ